MEPNKSEEKPSENQSKPVQQSTKKSTQKTPVKPKENPKEIQSSEKKPLKEICIEVCQNCSTHKWCTRHDEAKYNSLFEEAKAAIQEAIGANIPVVKNLNIKKPRIGAFEVLCNNLVIFSKIKSGIFPVCKALAERVKLFVTDYNSGNDVSKYGSIEEKKFSPPKKKVTQTSLDWNAKYEELKKSQASQKKNNNAEKEKINEEKPMEGQNGEDENNMQEKEKEKEEIEEKNEVKHEEKIEEKKEEIKENEEKKDMKKLLSKEVNEVKNEGNGEKEKK